MSLADLIRGKNVSDRFATATPATAATKEGRRGRTVASVATVAVANYRRPIPEPIHAPPARVVAGDTATASRWWLIHYPDRDPVEVSYCPEAAHAEILERHPDAIAAEPFEPKRRPATPAEARELRKLVLLVYSRDTVEDQREALTAALGDAENALQCYRNIAMRDGLTDR